MSPAVALIRCLHDHRLWVRLRLLEASSRLTDDERRRSFAIGMGSVHASLVHLYGAELVWLAAIEGVHPPRFPEAADFDGLAPLLRAWSDLDARWGALLERLSEADLQHPVTRATRAGVVFTTPESDVLLHVCTHAFYHAAQVVNMLRQLGVTELPETNLITMARERARG